MKRQKLVNEQIIIQNVLSLNNISGDASTLEERGKSNARTGNSFVGNEAARGCVGGWKWNWRVGKAGRDEGKEEGRTEVDIVKGQVTAENTTLFRIMYHLPGYIKYYAQWRPGIRTREGENGQVNRSVNRERVSRRDSGKE